MTHAAIVAPEQGQLSHSVSREEAAPLNQALAPGVRIRVQGKFFTQRGQRIRIQGVTYGPFAANAAGEPFPSLERTLADFELMRAASINALRTYHVPPRWLLDAAGEHGLSLLIDVPWARHLCFLDSRQTQAEARATVASAALAGRGFSQVFAYSIANEIPANIVRWHGARRVERFLRELADVARQAAPEALVTYANYPSTEYLDVSFADFATFNVYLHEREIFGRYLQRLQNLLGDRPLVLGELGMDSIRHSELNQAGFVEGHLREAVMRGLAGAFLFSWTDDWHTGGHQISDWAFGLTDRARVPKPAYHAAREAFERTPAAALSSAPAVSVVVCTYNGGQTLEQCLNSLLRVDYPHFEIIVVDDGSTDNTGDILARFPMVRAMRQENLGLSAARNVGLYAAHGAIVAYTDSDCFVDADWLTLLVEQLQRTGAAAVGGPNLTPDDGWLASCVAAAPGQPTHVLENDQVAEHIPGCNMAFRRESLLALNGFDYQYRKAGDDVDICWRLQQSGEWITFAPGAFVWHHRRQTPRAFFKQQAGYGEAEALLRFQHPDRFNDFGDGKWNGVLYGAAHQGVRIGQPMIHRGVFGTGLFQCLYQPRQAHWLMLPSTLEWHLAIAVCCLALPVSLGAAALAGLLWFLSLAVAITRGAQAQVPRRYDGFKARCVVMLLCYLQPLVRAWSRQRTRLFSYHRPAGELRASGALTVRCPWFGKAVTEYWSEDGLVERLHLLGLVIANLHEQGWKMCVDTGWQNWDLEVPCRPWTLVRIATAQEEHGGGRRLIRVCCDVRPSGYTHALWGLAVLAALVGMVWHSWLYLIAGGWILLLAGFAYWRGLLRAASVAHLIATLAADLGLINCSKTVATPPRPAPAALPVCPAPVQAEG